jgi:hypothetical protein
MEDKNLMSNCLIIPVPDLTQDYYVQCAVDTVRRLTLPRTTWSGYLEMLDDCLNYFLGMVDE